MHNLMSLSNLNVLVIGSALTIATDAMMSGLVFPSHSSSPFYFELGLRKLS